MILKYSTPNSVPYIEFDDQNKLIFSTLTEHPIKGFKWLAYSGKIVSEHRIGKGKRKKILVSEESTNFITDLKLTKIPKKVKDTTLTPKTLKFLKKVFKELTMENDNYFPKKNLTKLQEMIDNEFNYVYVDDITDTMDDDPDLDDEDCVVWR